MHAAYKGYRENHTAAEATRATCAARSPEFAATAAGLDRLLRLPLLRSENCGVDPTSHGARSLAGLCRHREDTFKGQGWKTSNSFMYTFQDYL